MNWNLLKTPETKFDWKLLKPPEEEKEGEKFGWATIEPPKVEDDITTPVPVTHIPPKQIGVPQRMRGIGEEPEHTPKLADPTVVTGAKVFGGAIKQLPTQIKAAALQVTQQGAKGASVANKDWADEYIKTATEEQAKFAQETIDKYGDISFLGIKLSDIANMPQSIAFSLTSMGAGVAAGLPFALTPLPGSRIVAWGIGTVASGKAAYEMSTYQIMQTYLEFKNEEKMAVSGQNLTLEEENNLKQGFNKLASQYGLWEAIPEAISNLAFFGVLTAPLTKMVGKTIAGKIVNKVAAMYGEELLTETITEIGQKGVMGEAGLPGGGEVDWTSPTEWVEALKAIAPQTALLTTLLGGTGTLILNTNKVVKSLKNEVKDSKIKDELIKKVENKKTLKEAVKEDIEIKELTPEELETKREMLRKRGVNEDLLTDDEFVKKAHITELEKVEPPPITGKGKVSKIAKDIEIKAIEAGLTKGFGHLAEFTPITIKDQVQRAANLMTNIDEARSVIRGEKPLPEGLNSVALIKAMDIYARNTKNGELASELANSPLVSGTSAAAQTLRMAAEIDPLSPVKAITDVNKVLDEAAKKRLPGGILNKAKVDTTNKIKDGVKGEVKKVNTTQSWKTFIESIRCQ